MRKIRMFNFFEMQQLRWMGWRDLLGVAAFACVFGACDDSDDADVEPSTGPYAVMSLVTAGDESLAYLTRLEEIAPQEIDFDRSREFSGAADMWAYGDALYIMEDETVTITKYVLEDDQLVEAGEIGFKDYGLKDFGFWTNMFLSPTKAYVVNETDEYIVWNPKDMEITGTVPMPELEGREGLKPFASYVDRSIAVRDGLLYHPFYYTDDDFFRYSPSSSIAVYDIETDELVRVIDAPCPGLDHATEDEAGNLYFSAWVFAPGGAATLEQPSTCVAKIAPDADEATVAFTIKDVTDGGEGGLFRYTGDGKALLSVLHADHADPAEGGDPSIVAYGSNWRFWSYDVESGEANEVETIDWNAGAAYPAEVEGRFYSLVPSGGYTSTVVFDITNPDEPEEVFEVDGWALRLLKLP